MLFIKNLQSVTVFCLDNTLPNGVAAFENVPVGKNYTLEEVNTDKKYIIPDSQNVTVDWDDVTEAYFENKLKRGSLRVTKSAEDGFVEGVRFHLYGTSLSGQKVDMYAETNASGIAEFKDMLIGSGYILEEVDTAERYIVPDSQTVNIEWDKATETRFENKLKRGTVRVTKSAEDGFVEGVRFHLYGTSLSGQKVDMYAETDASGIAEFKDVLIGSGYILEEVYTAVKYVIPDFQNADVRWNKVTNKSFDNRLKKWNAVVTKSDKETENAQGDATLKGAVYGVYKGTELIDKYTTDEKGRFTTKYYPCGDDWTIREIAPSEGYTLDETIYKVGSEPEKYTVEYNTLNIVVTETVVKGSISIVKHMDDGSTQIETPEKGAEFEIYLKSAGSFAAAKESERDRLICDEDGYAKSKLLPYGIYTVKQTKGSPGAELMEEFAVLINEDGKVYRYIINDRIFKSYVEIVKKDAETGKIIPVSGIGFKVRNTDTGKYVVQHVTYPTPMDIDTFYTDDTGRLMLPEALSYGNYEIIEVQTAYGYVLDKEPVPFMVDGTLATVTVEKTNMPQKGKITITKTGEIFSSVVQSGDAYQPVYEVAGLPGAVYEIIAAEDIYTPDGTLRCTKGAVADTVTTGSDGIAVSKELYLGKYEIREIQAPYGMVLNGETHTVELTYAGQKVDITETKAVFYNERQKVQIDLSKIMEQDETFGIGMNGEILSVQFGLFAAEDIVAADGSKIPTGGLIEIVTCDENGYVLFITDIPVSARLYVQEIAADEHYVLNGAKYFTSFDYAGQEIALVHIRINRGNPIKNSILRGKILGYKTDRETGRDITGALFGLFRPNETVFTEDTAILTTITDENGVFLFENVPFGDWVIVELSPAAGYLLNAEIYPVYITTEAEIVEIMAVNDRIPEIGTTAMSQGEKQIHPKEHITIEDTVEYKHLIPGNEYTLKGMLVDKATGEPFIVNGQPVISEITFVPEDFSGFVTVTFVFDGSDITQNTGLVVFESLYKNGVELAAHTNIEDENQTVTIYVPKIGTQASVEGKKTVEAKGEITVEDIISFRNLIPGKEYTVSGVLIDKATGKVFTVNGIEIRGEVTFIPEEPDGEITVTFTFDADAITTETSLVVFENITREGIEIAAHADIEDEGQTITILPPPPDTPQTGDNSNIGLWYALAVISALGLTVLVSKRKKEEK